MSSEQQPFQKVTLVPSESLHRLRQQHTHRNQAQQQQQIPSTETDLNLETPAISAEPLPLSDPVIEKEAGPELRTFPTLTQAQATNMVELLPKGPIRNRGRVLLGYLVGRVRLNDSQHVIYPDLEIGSNLFDLVYWSVLPLFKTGRNVSKQPLDVMAFAKLLHKLGDIPKYGIPQIAGLFNIIDGAGDNDAVDQTKPINLSKSTKKQDNTEPQQPVGNMFANKKRRAHNFDSGHPRKKEQFHWA